MEFQLPTFEQAMKMVETNEAFLHKMEEVDGFKVHIFNYRLANYTDFQEFGALEMRGLTFLEYGGKEFDVLKKYERFIHLHKFFNHGEQGGFEGIEDSPIQSVQVKEDGSMIVPIYFPNGNIHCKTRGTFFSEQAEWANKTVAENEALRNFIQNTCGEHYQPVFEFVSPFNQIVLLYDKPELRLLQIRNRGTGEYMDLANNPMPDDLDIKISARGLPNGGLQDYLDLAETKSGIEGWVVQFENGHMVKIKTAEYVSLHHLLTENLTRENEIISWILNETIDDVLGQVPDTDMRKDYALDIAKFLRYHINQWVDELHEIVKGVDPKSKDSRKNFAILNKSHFLFSVMMRCYGEKVNGFYTKEIVFEYLKHFLLKKTNKWGVAQDFLRNLGFTSEYFKPVVEE